MQPHAGHHHQVWVPGTGINAHYGLQIVYTPSRFCSCFELGGVKYTCTVSVPAEVSVLRNGKITTEAQAQALSQNTSAI